MDCRQAARWRSDPGISKSGLRPGCSFARRRHSVPPRRCGSCGCHWLTDLAHALGPADLRCSAPTGALLLDDLGACPSAQYATPSPSFRSMRLVQPVPRTEQLPLHTLISPMGRGSRTRNLIMEIGVTSPYLLLPLRSYEQALRDIEKRRSVSPRNVKQEETAAKGHGCVSAGNTGGRGGLPST